MASSINHMAHAMSMWEIGKIAKPKSLFFKQTNAYLSARFYKQAEDTKDGISFWQQTASLVKDSTETLFNATGASPAHIFAIGYGYATPWAVKELGRSLHIHHPAVAMEALDLGHHLSFLKNSELDQAWNDAFSRSLTAFCYDPNKDIAKAMDHEREKGRLRQLEKWGALFFLFDECKNVEDFKARAHHLKQVVGDKDVVVLLQEDEFGYEPLLLQQVEALIEQCFVLDTLSMEVPLGQAFYTPCDDPSGPPAPGSPCS